MPTTASAIASLTRRLRHALRLRVRDVRKVAPDAWAMAAVALARRRLKEFWRVLPAKTRSFMPLIATQGGAGFLLCFSGGG